MTDQTTPPVAPHPVRIAAIWAAAMVCCLPRAAAAQDVVDPAIAQSTLHPAGVDAANVASLFWIMTIAGAVIWLVVIGLTIYAVLGRNKPQSERFADRFILIGGVVIPSVLLAVLLYFGLRLLPDWRPDDRPDLRVHVTGEQFWWRITYDLPDGRRVETANALHLPVDAEVEFILTSTDVIHSFWIPVLGGKLDMIPGRSTTLRLTPTVTGTYRGVCAEYCGLSHALMAMDVIVQPQADFDLWLAAEAAPAVASPPPAYVAAGCPACHMIRGAQEAPDDNGPSAVGPDLTHLATRPTLAAGTLPLTREVLAAWITSPETFKPGARMPGYAHLPAADRDLIVDYLMELP